MDVWTADADALSATLIFTVGAIDGTFGFVMGDTGTASSWASTGSTVGACTCGSSRGTLGAGTLTDDLRFTVGAGCAGNGTACSSGTGGAAGISARTGVTLGGALDFGITLVRAITGLSIAGMACAGTSGSASEAGGGIG